MARARDGGRIDLPFSRPLVVEDIHEASVLVAIEADPGECEHLAAHIGIEAIAHLRATFTVRREGKSGLRVSGEMRANVRQMCVLSLEAFDTEVVEPIDLRFMPPAEPGPRAGDKDRFDPLSEVDPPDPIIDGRIDLGQVATEFLILGLDPYPRKPGAEFSNAMSARRDRDDSAFAVLQRLKKPDR